MRKYYVPALVFTFATLLLLQFQALIIQSRRAVAGSFGLRPVSHECIGWLVPAEALTWLFRGEVEFHLGLFHFRYSLPDKTIDAGTPMCLGQDIWYGE